MKEAMRLQLELQLELVHSFIGGSCKVLVNYLAGLGLHSLSISPPLCLRQNPMRQQKCTRHALLRLRLGGFASRLSKRIITLHIHILYGILYGMGVSWVTWGTCGHFERVTVHTR